MSNSPVGRPEPNEYYEYFDRYISLVPEADILAAMAAQTETTLQFLRAIPETSGDHRYAPGKWSIKEMVGHLIDAERVFAMRALYFARKDPAVMPGFEQDDWVNAADFGAQSLSELINEFEYVRRSNLYLFKHLAPEAWLRRGIANQWEFTVRSFPYAMVGHERYHLEMLRTRYL